MNRVTISKHIISEINSHLDIFIETNSISEYNLVTYGITIEQEKNLLQGKYVNGIKKKAHRNPYLNYEGELSNGRGSIKIIWKGFLEKESTHFPEQLILCIKNERLVFQ